MVFLVYTQLENHILNPIIMSKTVRISPLLVLVAVLVGASIGTWVGGLFGGFVAALLAIPLAGAFQVIVREAWRLTAPPPEADAEESDIIEAGGDAAREAREIARGGGRGGWRGRGRVRQSRQARRARRPRPFRSAPAADARSEAGGYPAQRP